MIIEPDALMEQSNDDDLVVFDCRFSLADTNAGRNAFERSHIPGAIYVHLNDELSSPIIPGISGRHPLPDPDVFFNRMEMWGIKRRSKIVIYDDMGGGIAARMWWMLTGLGQTDVSILNGGYPAWIASGLPVESGPMTKLSSRSLSDRSASTGVGTPRRSYQHPVCSAPFIQGNIDGGSATLVDCRARERYLGISEPIDPVAGHIPKAVSYPWMDSLDDDGRFLSASELRNRYARLGPHSSSNSRRPVSHPAESEESVSEEPAGEGGSIVCYCGSGVTATHTIFTMRLSGLDWPTLYPGSWSEWIIETDRPVIVESIDQKPGSVPTG